MHERVVASVHMLKRDQQMLLREKAALQSDLEESDRYEQLLCEGRSSFAQVRELQVLSMLDSF